MSIAEEIITIEDLSEPYYTIAQELGIEAAFSIAKMFGGAQVYFPTLEKHCNSKLRDSIIEEFDGYNFRELAKKYGYTERWIREIVKDTIKKERNRPHADQISFECVK